MVIYSSLVAHGAEPTNFVANGGAEAGKGDQPSLWFQAMIPADELTFRRDTQTAHTGNASLYIENHHRYQETVCNNWAQKLSAAPVGKTLELSGWIKTQDADSVNICLQCWDATEKNMLGFASTPIVRGDSDWQQLTSDPVIVPEGTKVVMVRAALTGLGKVWFDDISVTETTEPATKPMSASEKADLQRQLPGEVLATIPIDRDQMILAYMPDWAYGKVDNLAVANNQGGVRTMFGWPKIDPNLAGSRFILACYAKDARGAAGKIAAYPILGQWDEQTSWQKQPKCASDASAEFEFQPTGGWKTFDITKIVSAPEAQGVMLRFKAEDKTEKDWSGYQFVSREGEKEWSDRRPMLLVVK
jgi:hypothetical protein